MTAHKKIGFLSFGAWHPAGGLTHTGGDALRQTVELAVAAEEIGIDGAFVRVHHFARQLASPFPLLTAIGVRTSRIEIGTGVIDMRYENPSTWPRPRQPRTCSRAADSSSASLGLMVRVGRTTVLSAVPATVWP